jgi:acetyl esterase/lipase
MGYFNRFIKKLLFGLIAFLSVSSLSAQTFRYTNKIFQNVSVTENVVYTNAPKLNAGLFLTYNNENYTTNVDLKMDIHQALGDTSTNRPAIIFIHGGAFLLGNKNHDDMMAFCDTFALRGYVTASIQYRLGMNILNVASTTRAVYRGLQDGRAAVRFLRAHASIYGIDPNRIYMAGSSAGAFIALQDIYMNDEVEKPPEAGSFQYNDPNDFFPPYNQMTAPDLGSFDNGENLDQNGKPDAIMGLWGAIKHTDLITANDTTPVFLVHGSNDATVPFGIDHPFNFPVFPATYGSYEINKKLDALNFSNKETYFVAGEGHEFYGVFNGNWSNGVGGNAYWDTIVNKAINFFYQQHKPEASFSFVENYLEVSFTNTSSESKSWRWDFGDGQISNAENPNHEYVEPGLYPVTLYIENEIKSWDTISIDVTANAAPKYVLNFVITDGINAIEGASLNIYNQTLLTDSNGSTSLELEDGTYSYTISANDFDDYLDTLMVDGTNQNIDIILTPGQPPNYNCSFIVSDGNTVIEGANIEIKDQDLLTDVDGMTSIALENGTYVYTVSANGFESKTDSLTIDGSDQMIQVSLSILTAIKTLKSESFKVYPNPANKMVQIEIPNKTQVYHLQIIDLNGKELFNQTDLTHTFRIDVSQYSSGIYFIILRNDSHYLSRTLIVK